MCDYFRFWADVFTDCCHCVHPIAVDILFLLDWPLLTVRKGKSKSIIKNTVNIHTKTFTHRNIH